MLAVPNRSFSSPPQVANLPLIPNCPVPKELYEIDQTRIVGLIIDPVRARPAQMHLTLHMFDIWLAAPVPGVPDRRPWTACMPVPAPRVTVPGPPSSIANRTATSPFPLSYADHPQHPRHTCPVHLPLTSRSTCWPASGATA